MSARPRSLGLAVCLGALAGLLGAPGAALADDVPAKCKKAAKKSAKCEEKAVRPRENCEDNCGVKAGRCRKKNRHRPNAYERCGDTRDKCVDRCGEKAWKRCVPAAKGLERCKKKEAEKAEKKARKRLEKARKQIGRFVRIQPGSFVIGSPESEKGRSEERETQHDVTITRSFLLQATEVTQGQWKTLMGNTPSKHDHCGDDCPVESVNWWRALAYCNALSLKEGLTPCFELNGCEETSGSRSVYKCESVRVTTPDGNPLLCEGYRLPTEAEWEYAARAGTTSAYYGETHEIAWFKWTKIFADPSLRAIAKSRPGSRGAHYRNRATYKPHFLRSPKPVARLKPNAWGLYDMLGNVRELVWDIYAPYDRKAVTDPLGAPTGDEHICRGGSFDSHESGVRAAVRGVLDASTRSKSAGFRTARTLP